MSNELVTEETLNRAAELIAALGEKVGESAETLMTWYGARAPYELVTPLSYAFAGILAIFIFKFGLNIMRSAKHDDEGKIVGSAILMTGSAGMMLAGLIGFLSNLKPALMAIASPEIYAIEQIAKLAGVL